MWAGDPDGRRWQSVTLEHWRGHSSPLHRQPRGHIPPHPNGWSCNLGEDETDIGKGGYFPNEARWSATAQDVSRRDAWCSSFKTSGTTSPRLTSSPRTPWLSDPETVRLLERIVKASSNPGDVVLDPFCGCGTAVHAAQKLGRQWIGIDVTHLAISLIEKRFNDAFPASQYEVHGTPKDLAGARALFARVLMVLISSNIGPSLECAPEAGQDQAAGLTVCRAWWSSNWAGLR